jgi:hypothetical protein
MQSYDCFIELNQFSLRTVSLIVHDVWIESAKKRLLPVGLGYFAMGPSHFGRQSALLSSLSARLVCILIFSALLITQPVLFQHGWQFLPEQGEAQGILVSGQAWRGEHCAQS